MMSFHIHHLVLHLLLYFLLFRPQEYLLQNPGIRFVSRHHGGRKRETMLQ
jgi:hypothetical protein